MTNRMTFKEPMNSVRLVLGDIISAWKDEDISRQFWNDFESECVMGYRLPVFQRPPKWTPAQNVALIESLYDGLDIGYYVISQNSNPQYDGFLLDGQQRLRALQSYFQDEFKVQGLHWSEVDKADQRFFKMLTFSRVESTDNDFEVMKRFYDRLNFSGTPHEEHERALPLKSPTP